MWRRGNSRDPKRTPYRRHPTAPRNAVGLADVCHYSRGCKAGMRRDRFHLVLDVVKRSAITGAVGCAYVAANHLGGR